ncbi:p-aminobenzoyl-glutamate hydrolase subunit B [Nymphon striatum]|nr:p-aminobenzoyl-glutamate hydrolase subunit B [Nymphon striatum]
MNHNHRQVLADYAEKNGLKVTRGVADIPTAFTATYGSGKPVISILGEFDALPGISQKAQPEKEAYEEGAAGHGCGHNMFGTSSLGTPAEEKFFAKVWMVEAGLWDDVDVNLSWHPSADIEADVQSGLSLIDFIVEFEGQAAHASMDPWNVVNVVPDYAKLWVRVRDPKRAKMLPTYERVKAMAEGAAIMANVDYKISLVSGIYEVLVNRTGGAIMQKNLELLGPMTYTAEEEAFGKAIQKATGKPEVGMDASINPLRETLETPGGGSTDVGDVSWNVPNINLGVTVAPKGTPWHSWAVVACGGMSIGHKGMVYASKALGLTAVDLFTNPKLVNEVKEEFKTRKGDEVYKAMIDGPAPISGALKVPVILYILGILAMVVTAYIRKENVTQSSFNLVFIGALFFVVSDSILAIDKFSVGIPFAHILIMGTYATAQYLIMKGVLYQVNNED